MKITQKQRAIIFALINKAGMSEDDRHTMIYSMTSLRTASLKEVSGKEANKIIRWLENYTEVINSRCDRLRKTLLAQGYKLGWEVKKTIKWVEEHGKGKKRFNSYTERELMSMIKIMEGIIEKYMLSGKVDEGKDMIIKQEYQLLEDGLVIDPFGTIVKPFRA